MSILAKPVVAALTTRPDRAIRVDRVAAEAPRPQVREEAQEVQAALAEQAV